MNLLKRDKGKIVAIYDIGSASVGAGLVEVPSEGKPVILQTFRKDIPFQEEIDSYRFYILMLETLESVVNETRGMVGKKIADEAVCFFSSPWYRARFGLAVTSQSKPFSVTDQTVADAINEKVSSFEDSNKKQYHSDKLGIPTLVEKINMRTRLNGYDIAKYTGRKVTELEVDFFASVVPEKVLEDVKECISRYLSGREVSFKTSAFTSYAVIRHRLTKKNASFLYLDITGEVTDILWVREGVIQRQSTYPIGRNFILRKIAEGLRVSTAEAQTRLGLYRSGKADEESGKKIEHILSEGLKRWSEALSDCLRQFSRGGVTPRSIFFVSDARVSDLFDRALSEHFHLKISTTSTNTTSEDEGPDISYLGGKVIDRMSLFQNEQVKDAFLALQAAFLSYSQE